MPAGRRTACRLQAFRLPADLLARAVDQFLQVSLVEAGAVEPDQRIADRLSAPVDRHHDRYDLDSQARREARLRGGAAFEVEQRVGARDVDFAQQQTACGGEVRASWRERVEPGSTTIRASP